MTYTIKTEIEYQNALKRIEKMFDVEQGTSGTAEFANLVAVVELYEEEHYPLEK